MPFKSVLAKFNATGDEQIHCFHPFGPYMYVGTGPDGILYRTSDGLSLEEFWKTGSTHVTAVQDYGNALFVGTSPDGKILMHNFNTENRFHYVTTGDYRVNSFAVCEGILYVGTYPSGLVLSFDGRIWKNDYDSYGNGITDLISYNDALYVFCLGLEFIPCLKDGEWGVLEDGDEPFSVSAGMKVSTTIDIVSCNRNYDHSFNCAVVVGNKLFFAPYNQCNLYMYDGTNVTVAYQWDGQRIRDLASVGNNQLAVAVDDTVYLEEV